MKSGFSLVEVMVSLVIISLALVAWTSNFTVGTRGAGMAEEKTIAVYLGQAMLEEIRRVSFEDPNQTPVFGLESGEATTPVRRVNFDDVDDYNNWTESPPQKKDGSAFSGFNDYRRSVTVINVSKDNFNQTATQGSTDFKKGTVTVLKRNVKVIEESTVFVKGY